MRRWSLAAGAALGLMAAAATAGCEEDATSGAVDAVEAGALDAPSAPDASAPPTTAPPGSGSEFCDRTLGVVVSALEQCCTAADKTTSDYHFTHDLAAALLPLCRSMLDGSVTKGRVAYASADAEACYAAYADRYGAGKCANITQTFSEPAGGTCRRAFVGTGEIGASCAGSHECRDGLTCVGHSQASDGTCKAPPAISEPCGPARVDGGAAPLDLELGSHPACAAGARCDGTTGTCVKAAGDGEDCGFDDDCAAPLRCHLRVCGASGPSAIDGPCKSYDDCEPGLFCERTDAGLDGTCKPKRSAGGACTGSSFVTECIGRCDAPSGEPGTCASFCGSP